MRFVSHLARGLVLAALAAGIAVASASGAPPPKGYTCSGGSIPAGTYTSLTVTGTCAVDSGNVNVTNNATVTTGAALVAAFGGSDLTVGGDLLVRNNGILVLGCEPEAFICFNDPDQVNGTLATNDSVGHDLRATNALSVLAHHNTIGHNVSVTGGGGGAGPSACDSTALFGGPPFGTFEDNTIGHDASINGVHTCWLGFFRNSVSNDVRYNGNKTSDPDGNEVATNTIGGDLSCNGNNPKPQVGDSGGAPNVVSGHARGQCKQLVGP
ncbi:MAG TPA: hypothetical protein VNG04_07020 [Candidatus Acidoferrum sp.]|nr:hypothetical protein [Candidatus Acidoferrum sp.]